MHFSMASAKLFVNPAGSCDGGVSKGVVQMFK